MLKKRTLVVLGSLGATVFALNAAAAVTFVNSSPRVRPAAPEGRRVAVQGARTEKWEGSRAIVRDEASGKLRRPTQAELVNLVDTLRQLTAKPAGGMKVTTHADGSRTGSADGFVQVVLSRPAEDGTMETRCVESFEEAATFLGLVLQPSTGGKD